LRFAQLDDLADSFSRGFYNFSNVCGGTTYATSYQAFLNGCISSYQKGFGPFFLENRLNEYNFYVEDNFKARQNLTLNLGYRYEYVTAPNEVEDRIQYGYGADKNNHEPRVGLAYSPGFEKGILGKIFGGTGNSSIRMGYGIYHGRIFQSVFRKPVRA
jgi:outer membrane receptor protein involved in Fe transport